MAHSKVFQTVYLSSTTRDRADLHMAGGEFTVGNSTSDYSTRMSTWGFTYPDGTIQYTAALSTTAAADIYAKLDGTQTFTGQNSFQNEVIVSSNIFIVGYSSATAYYGDGSNLTGMPVVEHKITVMSCSIPGLCYQTNGIFYTPEIPYDCTITSASVTFGYDGTATSGDSSIFDIKVSSGFAYYTIFSDTTTALAVADGDKRKGTSALAVMAITEGWNFRVDCLDDTGNGGDPWMFTLWGNKSE